MLSIDKELEEIGRPVAGLTAVYRRCGPVGDFDGDLKKGRLWSDLAYLSTSQNAGNYKWENVRKGSEGQLFITIVCMTHGLGRDVAAVRNNGSESEVIFHRKTQFKVVEVEKDDKNNVHWLLQEIDSPNAGFVWGASST